MPYDDGLANLRTLWAGFHPVGRDFLPVATQPKGADQWPKSLKPNELPIVLQRARPAAAAALRHSKAVKSNPSLRRTAAKKIWTWRRNSGLRVELACASGGESHTSAKAHQQAELFAAKN